MKPKRSRPPLSLIDLGSMSQPATPDTAAPETSAIDSVAADNADPAAAEAADAELFAEAAEVAAPPRTIPVPRPRERDGLAKHAVAIAVAAGLVWAGALVAFVLGFQSRFGAFDYTPFQISVIAVLALLPFIFMLLAAQAIRQGARLAAATRQARELAQDVAIPAALAADQVGGAMEAMRLEIARAAEAASAAQAPLTALRTALSEETERLQAAAFAAAEAGRNLSDALSRERGAVGEASEALRLQAYQGAEALRLQIEAGSDVLNRARGAAGEAGEAMRTHLEQSAESLRRQTEVTAETLRRQSEASAEALRRQAEESGEALTAQSRLVADASDLAQVQLAEAQAALAARAADLAIAVAGVESTSDRASETLARQSERLERASEAVGSNLGRLQADLSKEREQLFVLAGSLRDDQIAFADAAQARTSGLAAAVAEARDGAAVVAAAAEQAQGSLRTLIASAADEMRRLAEAAAAEQLKLDEGARNALESFGTDAAHYREAIADQTRASLEDLAKAAEETRAAAALPIEDLAEKLEMRAKAVRAEIDQLAEAAFAAGQRADQAYDARMAAARALIEESAELVDAAGLRAAERIGVGLSGARGAVDDLAALMDLVEQRIAQLPESAREKAEHVRAAVERGAADLAQAARKTAEETQAIDAAFQERVRRNYEVLSEAVRLMGRVAAAAEPPSYAAAPVPAPPPSRPPPPPLPQVRPEPQAHAAPAVEEEAAQPIAVGERPLRGPMGLSGSLPSSPTAYADQGQRASSFSRAPAPSSDYASALRPRLRLTPGGPEHTPRAAEPAGKEDEWTWKELLSSIEEKPADDGLNDRMLAEVEALGIDAEALLPPNRTEEIAAVLYTGDGEGAREVVRMLAGTAIRRLTGRLMADDLLRAEADIFARRYQSLAREAIRQDPAGHGLAALLATDAGRVFLLLDAAAADIR